MKQLKSNAKLFFPFLFVLIIGIFFKPFILEGGVPIPADTIVGMYHPWRDVVWDNFTAGVPFKNFLTSDPVRQQYPWRELVINSYKAIDQPLWNPYSLAGTPLAANFQSAPFYIFNFLFFVFDFPAAWGILILLQPLLAGLFLYCYLRELGKERIACLVGGLSYAFSGFFIAWLEWGTLLHAALWLPLILLSIEKITKSKKTFLWSLVFLLSLTSSFFAGHLQTFFYVFLFSFTYLFWKLFRLENKAKLIVLFVVILLAFAVIGSNQFLSTLQFINLSARGVDQTGWQNPGWFIPWQNLVQFFAPDFFGNPTTLNYWGVFNYGEFVGYIGVIPLLFAFFSIFGKKDKLTLFFFLSFLIALSFALPTPWAKLPYQFKLPFISSSQPTRLLVIVDFSLAILAAIGFDNLIKRRTKNLLPLLFPFFVFTSFWVFTLIVGNLKISQRNLILPTSMFIGGTGLLTFFVLKKSFSKLILTLLLFLVSFDLLRFGWKFTPFTKKDWIFPETKTIEFLQRDTDIFRIMSTDRRIMPPNFSIPYRLQSVDGYDPLYLLRYGELIAVSERGKPDISPPFGFNRIITPERYDSRIMDLLGVKYVLSLSDLDSPKLDLVFREGETRVYFNKNFFPRAFLVCDYLVAQDKQSAINLLMDEEVDLKKKVIVEEKISGDLSLCKDSGGEVGVKDYDLNSVRLEVVTSQKALLVLTDSFYPGWDALVDGYSTMIYRADYNFRAIIVPKGRHLVVFVYGD